MNKELFPYLKSLSDLLTSAANTRIDSEVASMYIDLSKRLVDLMLIQNELSLVLEKKSLIKIPEAATKLEKVLGEKIPPETFSKRVDGKIITPHTLINLFWGGEGRGSNL